MSTDPICPECRNGKHINCDGIAWSVRDDELTLCCCLYSVHGNRPTESPPVLDPRTHARTSDPVTSHVAAHALSDKTTMMWRLLTKYARFPERGLTSDEVTDVAGYGSGDGVWKRVSDLKRNGWIEPTGATRPGFSGRPQQVCVITDEGREQLT